MCISIQFVCGVSIFNISTLKVKLEEMLFRHLKRIYFRKAKNYVRTAKGHVPFTEMLP